MLAVPPGDVPSPAAAPRALAFTDADPAMLMLGVCIEIAAPLMLPLELSCCASTRSSPVVLPADAKVDVASISTVPAASDEVIRVELDDTVNDDGTRSAMLLPLTLTLKVDDDKARELTLSGECTSTTLDVTLAFEELSRSVNITLLLTTCMLSSSSDDSLDARRKLDCAGGGCVGAVHSMTILRYAI